MNIWTGLGRLVRDPQTRMYGEANDKKMSRFTVACDRRGKKEEGQQSADFIQCVCYGKLADFSDTYLRQGTKVALSGAITTGSYTNKDGQKIYTTEVLVGHIEFAESKHQDGQTRTGSTNEKQVQTSNSAGNATQTDDSFMSIPDGAITEDVPFV